ncbi:MAG TPA: hypothetical protein VGK56_11040 [Anaerolineales bacterium]
MMKYRLVLVAGILLCVSDEGVAKDSTGSQIRLDHLKVFSQDGSESLTAVCRPTHATEHKRSPRKSRVNLPMSDPASARRNETIFRPVLCRIGSTLRSQDERSRSRVGRFFLPVRYVSKPR